MTVWNEGGHYCTQIHADITNHFAVAFGYMRISYCLDEAGYQLYMETP